MCNHKEYGGRSGARFGVLALLTLGGIVGTIETATAQSYDILKTITWDVHAGRSGMRKGANTGEMQTLVRIFADDKHGPEVVRNTKLGGTRDPAFVPDLTEHLHWPTVFDGAPVPKTYYWKKKGFDQGQAADQGQDYATLFDQTREFSKGTRHPEASATTTIKLLEPYQDAETNRWKRKGTIHIKGTANVKKIPEGHAPETAFAEAASGGFLKLTGEVEKIEWNNGEKHGKITVEKKHANGIRVSGIAQEGDAQGGINQTNHSKVTDPIRLSFTDMGSGEVLGSQDIFYDLWLASGNADVAWTLTDGLMLRSDAESTAMISYDTVSDWITNPLNGAVVLSDGILEATGFFAGLPWELSQVDGYYQAWLPADEFSPEYTLQYDASSLGDAVGDVLTELSADQAGYASAYDTVIPSPGSVWLFAAGVAAVYRRR